MTHITILGRRWFHRGPGNTYHSYVAYVDGDRVAACDFEYGYGEQYLHESADALERAGKLPERQHYQNGAVEPLWQWCERKGVKLLYSVSDVPRKKDLNF